MFRRGGLKLLLNDKVQGLYDLLPVSPHGEFAPTSTQLAIKSLTFIFLLPRKKDNIVRTMKQNLLVL